MPQPKPKLPGPIRQRGFTLTEMAIVIAIAGVFLIMAIGFAEPLINSAHTMATQEKMNKISSALAYYAVRNDRLPCAAAPNKAAANPPFGYEQGSGATGAAIPNGCAAAAQVGIIPFATLGLTADTAVDGWGNPFTYAVSPVFTQDPTVTTLNVHPSCRTPNWFYTDGPDPAADAVGIKPRSPRKARFCCPAENVFGVGTDLTVLDVNGTNVVSPTRTATDCPSSSGSVPNGTCKNISSTCVAAGAPPFDCCDGYNTADKPFSLYPNAGVPPMDTPTAVSYVLVSHGPNGLGAYILNTGGKVSTAGATAEEIDNSNTTPPLTLHVISSTDTGPAGYDDITLWRTQSSLFSDAGQSCATP